MSLLAHESLKFMNNKWNTPALWITLTGTSITILTLVWGGGSFANSVKASVASVRISVEHVARSESEDRAAIAKIEREGTELSRQQQENQRQMHSEIDRRIKSVEDLCTRQGDILVSVGKLQEQVNILDKRLDHILALLDAITQRKP